MSFVNTNIKHLRKLKELTQGELAEKVGIKRSLLGAYEEHRASPKIETIQNFSYFFQVPLETLVTVDLRKGDGARKVDVAGKTLRVLPVVVDNDEKERISVVPEYAEAGYAGRYADPEFIEMLPSFTLPVKELYAEQTYRLFQINGDSMLPIVSGSYVICSYIQNWEEVKDGECYVMVTKDKGIVYKRIWNQISEGMLLLKSDNPVYEPYTIEVEEVLEVWQTLGYLSFSLPNISEDYQVIALLSKLTREMEELRREIKTLSQ